MWLLCYILTITGVFPNDTTSYGYEARTDLRLGVISKSSWFRFPYPGKKVFEIHHKKTKISFLTVQVHIKFSLASSMSRNFTSKFP